MSHQWYGDKVTCGSWQDIWVNEGFATYCQGLTLDFMMNGYWFPFWLHDRINSITSLPDGSVFCYDTSTVARVFDWRLSYQKGAMVLHMLRWIIGDTAFFQGMKNIIADPQLAYDYAMTADIQQHFEAVSGLNLNEYFLDWIYREGHPVYTINALINPDSTVDIDISQIPSHSSVSFFELPVPLYFKNSTRDTILVFNHTYSGQDFIAEPGFVPDSVFFDPEMKLLALCDTIYLNFSVSIDQADDIHFDVQPNPAQDRIRLNFEKPTEGDIIISDIRGRSVFATQIPEQEDVELDISALAPGTYVIKITSAHNIGSCRFVKL
jgi:hypothetical protein